MPFQHICITGGLGFIGSHLVRLALTRWPGVRVTNLDLITYAGNEANLADCCGRPEYRFVRGDVRKPADALAALDGCDAVIHLAAESHVDRSILASDDFMTTNILGTHVMLEAARKVGVRRFLYVSTDEVYGSLPEPLAADEQYPLRPRSPYAASKTAADLLVQTYVTTHDFPALITRSSNNFGPYQYPEKLIPLFVTNLLEGRKVPLYGDGLNVRDWIYVTDHCEALAVVLERGRVGEVYNLGGGRGRTNREICDRLLAGLGKGESSIEYVADRPGHDRRYALNCDKIGRELGWQPTHSFEQALTATIEWYRTRRDWWEPIKSGAYKAYYEQQYGSRAKRSS
ncbi:MAG TPA: dTDP-glucose 4,6-dehydratase [Phycisphaerae bacterium]|nr:dTDP-glucose 4,6-dehydratase [Phycisphaerae bacterium]HNU46651.1 dTDP-glucose 4,6-dehydratase [Phycisphaerae bacterium]